MERALRLGDPLPRPNYERIELDRETNMAYWVIVLHEFDWLCGRIQSHLLYHNSSSTSRKGLIQ